MLPAEAPFSARSGAPGTFALLYGQHHQPSPECIVFSRCLNALKVRLCSQELHFGVRSPGTQLGGRLAAAASRRPVCALSVSRWPAALSIATAAQLSHGSCPARRGTTSRRDLQSICLLSYILYIGSLEKAMAPHSSPLAWKLPWMEEPGGLQSMGSRRVGHD